MLNPSSALSDASRPVNPALLSLPLEHYYQTDDEITLALYAEYEYKEQRKKHCVDRLSPTRAARPETTLLSINLFTQFYSVKDSVCIKCGSMENLKHHHIVYGKETGLRRPVVALCKKCHSRVTSLNTNAVHFLYKDQRYKPLTDEQRVFLFNKIFMQRNFRVEEKIAKKALRVLLEEKGFLVVKRLKIGKNV